MSPAACPPPSPQSLPGWQPAPFGLSLRTAALFRELPRWESYLRPHVTLAELDCFAQAQSDTEAALAMQRPKRKPFQSFHPRWTA